MATIVKRTSKDGSTSYQVKIRMKGALPATATFERLTDAKKWEQDTESNIRNGRHFKNANAKKYTVADAIDMYLPNVDKSNRNRYSDVKQKLGWWKKQLGYCILSDLSKSLISEKLELLYKTPKKNGEPRSPATVNRHHDVLSHVLTYVVNTKEWLTEHPMRKIKKMKEPRGRVRFLNDDERERLLRACRGSESKYLYIIVVLALSTGMRRGEILNLRWPDVDLKRGTMILHQTKNGERRTLPLTGPALALVKEHRHTRRNNTDLLFPSRKDPDKPIAFRESWLNAIDKAGIEDCRFHDLRHSAASYLAMNGATLAEIAEVLGHKTLAMVKRYAHLSEPHTASVVESMNKKIFGDG